MVVPFYVQPIVGGFYRRGGHDALLGLPVLHFDYYTEVGRSNSFYCFRAGVFLMVQLVSATLTPATATCFSHKA